MNTQTMKRIGELSIALVMAWIGDALTLGRRGYTARALRDYRARRRSDELRAAVRALEGLDRS